MNPGVTPATTWSTVGTAAATLVVIVLKNALGLDLGTEGMGALAIVMAFLLPYFAPEARRAGSVLDDASRKKLDVYVQQLLTEQKE